MRVSVCLGAILIPEYLDLHSGIYSYSGISQTNAPLDLPQVDLCFSLPRARPEDNVRVSVSETNRPGKSYWKEPLESLPRNKAEPWCLEPKTLCALHLIVQCKRRTQVKCCFWSYRLLTWVTVWQCYKLCWWVLLLFEVQCIWRVG